MPKWVDDCVKRYLKKGFTEDQAWERCMGAYNKQVGKRKRGKKKKKKK